MHVQVFVHASIFVYSRIEYVASLAYPLICVIVHAQVNMLREELRVKDIRVLELQVSYSE